MANKDRDKSIDVLRAIALTGMIIIHISPTIDWISEIRSFDVPLMVFLSGVSFSLSGGNKTSYSSYVLKRFQRLILPTWIFLIIFHTLYLAVSLLVGNTFNINGFLWSVISRFSLMTGWYVWIMRLFFIVALFAPLIATITKSFKLIHLYFFIIIALLLNEILVLWIGESTSQDDWRVILEMNIPYLVIFCIGSFVHRMSRTSTITMIMSCLVAFLFLALLLKTETGAFQSLQLYKYPPQAYYIIYGLFFSLLLWLIRNKIVLFFSSIKILGIVEFIGSHTMWIYFWHIFLVVFVAEYISIAAIRFLVVFVFACLFTFLQSIYITKLSLRCKNQSARKMLLMLFNG